MREELNKAETALAIRGESAIMSVQMQELDKQVTTAMAYPRNMGACIEEITAYVDTLGPENAEDLYYILPHYKDEDGRPVEGPSVRLAEMFASVWGNLRIVSRVVDIGDSFVTAEAVVWDLQKNTAISVQKSKSIKKKNGERYSENMIMKMSLAAQSVARRDAIFQVVPRPVIDRLTKRAKALAIENSDMPQRRQKLIKSFDGLGVTEKAVLKYLNISTVEEITPTMLADMRGLYTAIKEGTVSIEDVFEVKKKVSKNMDDAAKRILTEEQDQEKSPFADGDHTETEFIPL